jgi:hypothetical protein
MLAMMRASSVTVTYVLGIGLAAASMVTIVRRYEPNRLLAYCLSTLIFFVAALAILDKLE